MSENINPQGEYRTETVIEVVDTSRQRRVLSIALIVLLILIAAVGYYALQFTKAPGAPSAGDIGGIEWVRSIYGWGESPNQLLGAVVDVAVAPDGSIWTVSNKTTVVAFNPDGTTKNVFAFERGGKEGQVGSIEGLDVGDDGLIYLADFGNDQIHVMDASGRFVRHIKVQRPSEVAVRDGRIAVAAIAGIGVLDTQGNLISQWGSRGAGKDQVDIPHGIAWGADGNVYVSDSQNRRIKAYTPEGRLIYIQPAALEEGTRIGDFRETSKESTSTLPYQLPAGMTVDAAGRVVLVDPFEFAIIAQDPKTGNVTGRWGEFGRQDGMFAYPTGISYDQVRDYYVVADTANNRLQVVRLPGSGGNVLTTLRRNLTGPIWICAIPLILLLLALVIAVIRRRNKRRSGSSGVDR